MKRIILCLLMALSIGLKAQTVKIAAAANLRYVIEEIKAQYEAANPKAKILITLGSSGTLSQQITNGADFDLFMAADKIYPEKLKVQGVVSGEVKTYAFGKLVIWSSSLDVTKGVETVADNSVKKIAIAKPELAPYGDRALECLKYYKLFEKVKEKIVYADNISQTAQFAQTGNAEIGFLALSLVIGPEMKGSYFIVDMKSYKPIAQGMVLIKSWQSNPEAAKFMRYVLSAACKPLFTKYGYITP
jgi:molybdate transport system substrate-binding protein